MNEDPEVRSRIMRAVGSRDTQAELVVRRAVHALGYRFRLYREDLPGKPDLALPRLQKVIFVHGCFWHGHDCPRGARVPRSNQDYWIAKIARNRIRDQTVQHELCTLGWQYLLVWECETANKQALRDQLAQFLARS